MTSAALSTYHKAQLLRTQAQRLYQEARREADPHVRRAKMANRRRKIRLAEELEAKAEGLYG